MKIRSIKLENFRGFKSFEQNLSPRLNVFIGKNGSGKTTILDAISMNINHGIHRLTSSDPSGKFYPEHSIDHDDINNDAKECHNSVFYTIDDSVLEYGLHMSIFNNFFKYSGEDFENYFAKLRQEMNKNTDLPTIVYYNTEKEYSIEDASVKTKNSNLPQLNAYYNASNKKPFSFKEFVHWFRQQEDIENEIRLKSDSKFSLGELDIVRSAIINIFSKIGNTTFYDLSVIRARPHIKEDFNFSIRPGGELFIKKDTRLFKVNQLSTGEKNVLLIVSDIASKIAQLNPSLASNEHLSPSEIFNLAQGVVLIDEIDQHLHPSWQKRIIPALIDTFPNIQFILTTHSENIIISILKMLREKELSSDDISIFNLLPYYDAISSEKLEINLSGQIEGGLSSFYQDQMEDIDNFFNI